MSFQRKRVALALALTFGVGGTAALLAGAASAADERITVTGTNIRQTDVETASPVQIITRDAIERSGLNSIADVIHTIPANNNGTVSDAFTNGFAAGASGISLRGLGVSSTLVLVNGRRMAVYGLADDGQRSFVDLDQIPLSAVERIEIVKDGASAIYGSDAIAGVVNIILRKDFQGATVNASYGQSHKNDGKTYTASATFGWGDLARDKYNVFINLDAQKADMIPIRNRPKYIGSDDFRPLGFDDERGGNPFSGFGSSSLVGNVAPVDAANPQGPRGTIISLPGCNPANVDPDGYCRFEYKDYIPIQPKTEKYNVFAKGTMNFNENLQGYAEFGYFKSKVDAIGTPSFSRSIWPDVRDSTVISSTLIFLPVGHPDNPFSGTNQVARLYYETGELGGRNGFFDTDTQRYLVGLKGSNWDWEWDAGALYIKSKTDSVYTGFLNYSNFLQALAGQGGFGYYRIGANSGLNNPGIYGFVAPNLVSDLDTSTSSIDFKATRDLMQLPGGPLGIAVGAEYRREQLDNPGIPGTFGGEIMGLGYSAGNSTRNVTAAFVELNAPVMKNLELSAAARIDHYSDYGNSTTPKIGVRWTPVPQLLLRGTYAEGFRAPGPYENGNSSTAGFTSFVDPIRCPVTGNPADCGGGNVVSITGGNKDIKPEKSKSYTLGVVWEPMPGLSGTADYWKITRRDEIVQGDPQAILDNPTGFPQAVIIRDVEDPAFPGLAGPLLAITTPYLNANQTKTDGVDLSARYRWNMKEWGSLTTEAQWTHIMHFERTLTDGTTSEYAGTHGPTALSSSAGTPKDRANLILGWERGPWNVTGIVKYVSGMDDIESKGGDCLHPDLLGESCRVASFTTLDLTASYEGFKNWKIYGSILNVFNKLAPFDPQAGYSNINYNYNFAQSGAIGTFFTIGARYTFK